MNLRKRKNSVYRTPPTFFDSDLESDESANSDLDEEGEEFFIPEMALGGNVSSRDADSLGDNSSENSEKIVDSFDNESEDILRKKQQNGSNAIPSFFRHCDSDTEEQSQTRASGSQTSANQRKRKRNAVSETFNNNYYKQKRSSVRKVNTHTTAHKSDDEYDIVTIVEDALSVFGLTINSVTSPSAEVDTSENAKKIQTAIESLSSNEKRDFARAIVKTPPTTFVGARFSKRHCKMGPKDPDSVLNRDDERKDGVYVRLSKIKHMRAQHVHYIHNLCNQYMSLLQSMIDFSLPSEGSETHENRAKGPDDKFQRLIHLSNLLTDVCDVVKVWPNASTTRLCDTDALEKHISAVTREICQSASKSEIVWSQPRLRCLVTAASALERVKTVCQNQASASSSNTTSGILSSEVCDLSFASASKAIRVEIAFLLHDMACTGTWDRFRTMYGGPKARLKDEYMTMMRHGMDARVQEALDRIFTPDRGGKVQFAQQLRDFARVEHVQSFSRYVENNFKQKVCFHVCDQIEDVRHLRNKHEMATMMWDTVMAEKHHKRTNASHEKENDGTAFCSPASVAASVATAPPSPERRRRRRGVTNSTDRKFIEQAKHEQSIYDEFFAPFDMDNWCTVQLIDSSSTDVSLTPSVQQTVRANSFSIMQKPVSAMQAPQRIKKSRKNRWQQCASVRVSKLPPIVV